MKKSLSIFIALAILSSFIMSCSQRKDNYGSDSQTLSDSTSDSSLSNTESESTETESVEDTKIGNIPDDVDLGENEFTILSRDDPWLKDEVSVEISDGDPINNAIASRNLAVEHLLNAKIVNQMVFGNDYCIVNELKKTIGPDCPYQITANSAYTSFENVASGLCHNLLDVSTINLNEKYWSNKFNPEASVGNAQYFATGDISLSMRRFIFVTFFNKQLAEKYNLENLYDVVRENRWTIDYQSKIVSNMFEELDGIEGQTDGDFFGFLTNSQIFVDPYIASCDMKILTKNEDNYFDFNPDTELLDLMFGKINELYYECGGTMAYEGLSDYSDLQRIIEKFTSSEATMITHRLIAVESAEFRNMSSEYGIIPIPKLNESQQDYYSLAHDLFTVYGIVSSVNAIDLENVGYVLEAMAFESYKKVRPAYYEVALKGKYSKDPESWEMLDMITENLKINGGLLYTIKLADVTQKFRTAVYNKNPAPATTICEGVSRKAIERGLQKLQNDIKKYQNAQ